MNPKLSGIAAAAGFVLSLLIGVLSGGALSISLLRALFFGMIFFILASVVWLFINRFLPELLLPPEEEPLMTGLETGSRVDISVGDDMPINAAVPPEDDAGGDLGNVTELAAREPPARSEALDSMSLSGSEGAGPVLDLGAQDGYSKGGPPAAPGEKKQSATPDPEEKPGAVFTPLPPPAPLQSFSGEDSGSSAEGGIATLPDLDAMAGAFMSSDEEEGEETAVAVFGPESKARRPGKAKGREDDYNPKEVASAIQTLLKRD
jgi:hypothetical protein